MTNIRLAFLIPALLLAAPVVGNAAPREKTSRTPIRYVTLDKMIRGFAEQARQQQATRSVPKPATTIVAAR